MGRPKGSKNKAGVEKQPDESVFATPVVNDENVIRIDDLGTVVALVKRENEERERNPGMILDGEAGTAFIEGQPHIVIDNAYVPYDKAQVIIQTRKVVREWLKLEELKKTL